MRLARRCGPLATEREGGDACGEKEGVHPCVHGPVRQGMVRTSGLAAPQRVQASVRAIARCPGERGRAGAASPEILPSSGKQRLACHVIKNSGGGAGASLCFCGDGKILGQAVPLQGARLLPQSPATAFRRFKALAALYNEASWGALEPEEQAWLGGGGARRKSRPVHELVGDRHDFAKSGTYICVHIHVYVLSVHVCVCACVCVCNIYIYLAGARNRRRRARLRI